MSMESIMDAVILIIYARGTTGKENESIRGITRLEKLIFLLTKDKIFQNSLKDVNFEPYNYGPFSSEVYDVIEALKNYGFLSTETVPLKYYEEIVDGIKGESEMNENISFSNGEDNNLEVYSLTSDGLDIAQALFNRLTSEEKIELEKIKKQFNSIPFLSLLRHVYSKYPESTIKSKIRERLYE